MAWHWTNGDRLRDGRQVPPVGEWLEHAGPVEICEHGLHASERLIDALAHAPGVTLHRVECENIGQRQSDKFVCRRRKVVASADMAEALCAFAQQCAIRAAERARASADAADAAAAAADAARYAAYAADDAARYAAYAAASAADAARYAAYNEKYDWQDRTLNMYAEMMMGSAK